jgi:hypothetical protein
MQHAVDIYRDPTGAYGTRGELIGSDALVAKDVPCSIVTLSGREAEQARSSFPYAAHQVEMFGDPAWRLDEFCKLVFGERVLHVGHVYDVDQRGVEFILLVGEDKQEAAA